MTRPAALLLALALCATGAAQPCPTSTAVYLEDLAHCRDSVPEALRSYTSAVLGDVLLTDDGNKLRVYSLSDPARPAPTQTASFNVPALGDIDWMLVNLATNPASPYGVGTWRTATGVWRWDAGRIVDRRLVSAQGRNPGVVYVADGASYVLSSDIHGEPGTWALRIDSTSSLVPLQRVTGATVSGGLQIGPTVYAVERSGLDTVVRVYSIGAGGSLSPVATAGTASGGWSLGLAADGGRLIAASGTAVRLWDVSSPPAPVLLDTVAAPANVATLEGLMAVTVRAGVRGSERVWSIVGDELTDITPGWFAGRWAEHAECVVPRGVALAGGRLYYAQWAVAEAIDLRCLVPMPGPPAEVFEDGFESGDLAAWD